MASAYAKINLFLDVLSKRPDGYHDIQSIMQSISLCDLLLFEKHQGGVEVSSNWDGMPGESENLVSRSVELLRKLYPEKIDCGVVVHITKNIPIAAGLAGGSADAAASIRAINLLFGLGLSMDEMMDVGKDIGSDVPFCLIGGTAMAEGRGDLLTPLKPIKGVWVVTATIDDQISTREIYSEFDKSGQRAEINIKSFWSELDASKDGEALVNMENVFEPIATRRYPQIAGLKAAALESGAFAAAMSGSGPAVFCVCHSLKDAQRVYNRFSTFTNGVYIARTMDRGTDIQVLS
ncbi:MAG: 4-(cytidine 5'-diphospho)-2-C-methyl-D-erythritol kinase [Actinobacteria bacterium]|nr:4-(cytidine 5'-diphospho)-2-C-methyl-D-erythritol kinase [Actinomycetota bacterium]